MFSMLTKKQTFFEWALAAELASSTSPLFAKILGPHAELAPRDWSVKSTDPNHIQFGGAEYSGGYEVRKVMCSQW